MSLQGLKNLEYWIGNYTTPIGIIFDYLGVHSRKKNGKIACNGLLFVCSGNACIKYVIDYGNIRPLCKALSLTGIDNGRKVMDIVNSS